LSEKESGKAQHTPVCEHFSDSFSLKRRQMWPFGELC
jgi:hypothetical protein